MTKVLEIKPAKPTKETIPEDKLDEFEIDAPEFTKAKTKEEVGYKTYKATLSQVHSEMCVPGFKALVNLASESSVDLELIELEPMKKKEFEKDMAKLNFHIKKGVEIRELMTMMKEDEFPSFKPTEAQPVILDVVDKFEHATVTKVLVQESIEKQDKSIGTKSIIRTIETGKETMEEVLMDVSKEFGPFSKPAKEMATVAHLLNEGVKCDEVITLLNTGEFPELQKPETQTSLVSIVSNKGHASTVCEILTEDAAETFEKFKPKTETARFNEVKHQLEKATEKSVTVKTFTTDMAPAAKAVIKMAKEELVEEKVQKSEMKEVLKEEMVKIVNLLKHGVVEEEVLLMMEAGEFPNLIRDENQANILNVVEDFGFTAIVNRVVVEQAVQKKEQNVGIRAFIKMAQQQNFNIEQQLTESLTKEFGPERFEPIREMAKVNIMLKEGVQAHEIITMVETGQLPELSKTETQGSMVKVIQEEGHSAIVCQVLIDESVKEISKDLPKVDVAKVASEKIILERASETEVIVQG
ncbi:UNVERIFIED_CONTAM: hypothetical protein GTU68_027030 [Idotea baltica]|nr:hypothetical protein [Idotea baltica]